VAVPLDDPIGLAPTSRAARILAALAIVAVAVIGPAVPALAAQGSVPSEVSRYATDPDGLLARLDDLFGVTTSGQGVEFGDTTEAGVITRAWVFTAGYLSGDDPETAVELANLWSAPILIDGKPVGLATIWINPATDAPDLADFVLGTTEATSLSEVPDDAQLVWDEGRGAWFGLVAGKLVALVPGTSGVVGSTTLVDYQAIASGAPAPIPQDLSGLVGGGILIGASALAILVVLVIPLLRRRGLQDAAVTGRPAEPGGSTPALPELALTFAATVPPLAAAPDEAPEAPQPKTSTIRPATPGKPASTAAGKPATTAAKKPATTPRKPTTSTAKPASSTKQASTAKPPKPRPAPKPPAER
jgi:hypothetical protein